MGQFSFNFGITDITPDEPVRLGGFANRVGLSGSVHRSLQSRCLVLKDNGKKVCIIVNDLLAVQPEIADDIQTRIARQSELAVPAVILCATHTHSAPSMEYGVSEANDHYINFASEQIIANACETILSDTSFKVGFIKTGTASCDISSARKLIVPESGPAYRVLEAEGLTDDRVKICRIVDENDSPQVTIFNYACHPVTLGHESTAVSPDYPGRAREVIEQADSGFALFLNGAAGDINPVKNEQTDLAVTDWQGERLGKAVLSARLRGYNGDIELKLKSRTIELPFRDSNITKEFIDSEVERKSKETTEFDRWQEHLENWKRQIYEMIDRKQVPSCLSVSATALKVGPTVFFFTQGEPYVKYQIELSQRFEQVELMCFGYTAGECSYIPTAESFADKGYETNQAYIFLNLPSPLTPKIEEIYLSQAGKLIKAVI